MDIITLTDEQLLKIEEVHENEIKSIQKDLIFIGQSIDKIEADLIFNF